MSRHAGQEPVDLSADPDEGLDIEMDENNLISTAQPAWSDWLQRDNECGCRMEFGRHYHGYRESRPGHCLEGRYKPYFMPNDMFEGARLDCQHDLMKIAQNGRLFLCPAGIEIPLRNVLDAGCGTGIWSVEFAQEHPKANVLGVDITLCQLTDNPTPPPNATFARMDLDDRWQLGTSDPFQLIYARFLGGAIESWPGFFRQSYEVLGPGGWLEVCDFVYPMIGFGGTIPTNSAVYRFNRLLIDASRVVFVGLDRTRHYAQQMKAAGFQKICEYEHMWPLGSWPVGTWPTELEERRRYIGSKALENAIDSLQALSLQSFTTANIMNALQVRQLCNDVAAELMNPNSRMVMRVCVVYGQKPWVDGGAETNRSG